jgi:hypothetical protein
MPHQPRRNRTSPYFAPAIIGLRPCARHRRRLARRRVARGYGDDVNPWLTLTPEQYAVMITAHEEGMLISVLDAWRARIRWAETGTTRTPSDLTDDMKRDLVPRFAPIVADLVDRDIIEVAEYQYVGDDGHQLLLAAEQEPVEGDGRRLLLVGEGLRVALRDPACWIWRIDMRFRPLHLATTDAWERSTRSRELT